ncbi:MAG TPA: NRDE family protein [Chloroflexota bacterium]|nr:NRDE family protein [Chloroflexota bacterium]
MCFILILTRVRDDYPLIVAANRDESRARPSEPPHRWDTSPGIWAGRDVAAGGTWLGVNDRGVLAAITNRRDGAIDRTLPSRGGLCLDVLLSRSTADAEGTIRERLAASRYNPFNLLCADVHGSWSMTWRGDRQVFEPGPHVITNEGDPDGPGLPTASRGLELLARVDYRGDPLDEVLRQLGRICADTDGPTPICRPGGERGTVSSSLIALSTDGRIAAYWHANGPPSDESYAPVELGAQG